MNIRKIGKTVTKRTAAQSSKTKKRTPIEPLVKSYLGEAARNDRNATGKQIGERVKERLRIEGLLMDVPGVRAIQDIAKEARSKTGTQLDDAWSLAVTISSIPPEATLVLLHVWKLCLALGYILTIREAQWIARIRTAIPQSPSHLGKLFYYAHEYAIRERVYNISKKAFDTRDLDAELIMGDMEKITFEALGLIPHQTFAYIKEKSHHLVSILSEKGDAAHLAILENIPKNARGKLFDDKERFTMEKFYKREDNILTPDGREQIANAPKTDNRFKKLSSFSDGLPLVQNRIFAAVLVYLSKGTLWNTLSMDDYISILSYLKGEVTKTVSSLDTLRMVLSANRQCGLKPEHIISPEILQMVGHQVTNATKEGTK